MLAYIDKSPGERVHVRYSSDGLNWSLGDPAGATADAGIGAAASEDGTGLLRMLVHNGNVGAWKFRMSLGPATWDANDVSPTGPSMRGAQIAYGAAPGWLVTTLGGQSGFVPTVLRYGSAARTLTDVSPGAAALNMGGLAAQRAPAIATRGNRIVLAYLRYSGSGPGVTLRDLQIVTGNDVAGGTPTWSPAATFGAAESGFGPPLTEPALGHDTRQFLLGVVRQATAPGAALRLFIYGSPNGTTWSLVRTCDLVPAVPANQLNVSLAGKSDGVMVVMFTAPGVGSMVRYTAGGGWSPIASGLLFGSDVPNWYPTALIRAGEPPAASP